MTLDWKRQMGRIKAAALWDSNFAGTPQGGLDI